MTVTVIRLVCALAVLATACSREPAPKGQAPAPRSAAAPAAQPPTPGQSPPDNEVAERSATTAAADTISGPVMETMDAGTYTYVRVKSGSNEVWAATSRFPVKVGDRVTVPLEMPMRDFHSKSLDRDFPVIYFASAIAREGERIAGDGAAMQPMNSHSPGHAAAVVTERIPPTAGVTPVDQVWANRASLAGKPVTVRGKVVKYNGGIMGVNWLHIQDGTGKAGDENHDLAVTTTDDAAVGDVVTATGTVSVDKDFGAGYAYRVIVEKAALRRP
jgi:hypothetical protein